mmetsp:Transcript_29641/g.65624  ORF Transcript_29641/g.65624 Transcript_29641/m.65624 type:complete len:103 (-) Transcript_29641:24-332(-)
MAYIGPATYLGDGPNGPCAYCSPVHAAPLTQLHWCQPILKQPLQLMLSVTPSSSYHATHAPQPCSVMVMGRGAPLPPIIWGPYHGEPVPWGSSWDRAAAALS